MNNLNDFKINDKTLLKYLGNEKHVVIPDTVDRIASDAFQYGIIESVVIPESVTSIGFRAFYFCQKLSSLTIPSNLKDIGSIAFKGCRSLANDEGLVIVNDILFDINSEGKVSVPESVKAIGDDAFMMSKITSVQFNGTLESIGNRAFYNCIKLDSIVIPKGVKVIKDYTFAESALREITLPDSIEEIEKDAFKKCKYISVIHASDTVFNLAWKQTDKAGKERIAMSCLETGMNLIPIASYLKRNAVTIIPQICKLDHVNMMENFMASQKKVADVIDQYIELANDSEAIRNYLLNVKSNMGEIKKKPKKETKPSKQENDPSSLTYWKKLFTLKEDENGYCVAKYRGKEVSVVIPEAIEGKNVYAIGNMAFKGKNIEEVVIPESIQNIGERAFCECKDLKKLVLPKEVNIAPVAFYDCAGLADENGFVIVNNILFRYMGADKEIRIPDSVKVIDDGALERSKTIETVYIPKNVERIKNGAFYGCKKLSSVIIENPNVLIYSGAFDMCNKLTIIAPEGSDAAEFAKNMSR